METTDLLPALGFTPFPDRRDTDQFALRLGPLELTAFRTMNKYCREVVICYGYYVTERAVADVHFEVPVQVPSMNHLKALLSYYLKGDVSGWAAEVPKPFWFDEGMRLEHLLPWRGGGP